MGKTVKYSASLKNIHGTRAYVRPSDLFSLA